MTSRTSVWEGLHCEPGFPPGDPRKGCLFSLGVSSWMGISPLSWPCTDGFRILATWIRGAAQVSTERLFITEGILQPLWHSVFSGKEWEDYSNGVSVSNLLSPLSWLLRYGLTRSPRVSRAMTVSLEPFFSHAPFVLMNASTVCI